MADFSLSQAESTHVSDDQIFDGLGLDGLTPQIAAHIEVLREKVFESTKYLPQFDLLLSDLLEFRRQIKPSQVVISVERMLLYGKNLFSPLFSHSKFISLDSSPESADSRGAYNARLVDDERFINQPCESIRCEPNNLRAADSSADCLLVPNLVHHVEDQHGLWSEVSRVLKSGGKLYIFEPTIRELHQVPDDYLRYTPNGLKYILANYGFGDFKVRVTGGPFTAIAYCWNQALQYIHPDERLDWSIWFEGHFKELELLEKQFTKNLVRSYTSFPTAFSLVATKN